jgi:hypothetical protein
MSSKLPRKIAFGWCDLALRYRKLVREAGKRNTLVHSPPALHRVEEWTFVVGIDVGYAESLPAV